MLSKSFLLKKLTNGYEHYCCEKCEIVFSSLVAIHRQVVESHSAWQRSTAMETTSSAHYNCAINGYVSNHRDVWTGRMGV